MRYDMVSTEEQGLPLPIFLPTNDWNECFSGKVTAKDQHTRAVKLTSPQKLLPELDAPMRIRGGEQPWDYLAHTTIRGARSRDRQPALHFVFSRARQQEEPTVERREESPSGEAW